MSRRTGRMLSNLRSLEDRLKKERRDAWDLYAPLTDLRFEVRDSLAPLPGRFTVTIHRRIGSLVARPTVTSFGQICNLLRVPPQFIERVPAAVALRLFRTLQETSEASDGRSFLLRLRDRQRPVLRAVLPHSYVRFDDDQVMQAILARGEGDLSVQRVEIDEDLLSLRLTHGSDRGRVNLGSAQQPDPGFTGFALLTSETGAHPLEMRTLVVRQVCENGLTVPAAEQQVMRRRFVQVERSTIERALSDALTEVVPRGRELAERLAATRAEMVPDASREVSRIFRRHGLGSPRGRIGQWVRQEVERERTLFGTSRFGIVQAVTAVARDLESRDRLRFEDAMGAYVTEAGAGQADRTD